MRLTRTAPRYTVIAGIAALSMPSSEYRTSDRGEAAQASAMPSRKFFFTRPARLLGVEAGSFTELAIMDSCAPASARAVGD